MYDDLTVTGDLFVDGTTWVVNNQEVTTSDNLIVINNGEPGAGVTAGWAGFEIDRGSLDSYFFMFAEATDTFRIGASSDATAFTDLQAVASREDSPTNMVVPYWNDTAKRFDTAGSSSITVNTSTDVITMTAASSPVATFESDGLTLASGTNINEFSTDGTLAGDSDNAVPTEAAVKTYVDAGDAATLASANAYTDAAVAGIHEEHCDTGLAVAAGIGTVAVVGAVVAATEVVAPAAEGVVGLHRFHDLEKDFGLESAVWEWAPWNPMIASPLGTFHSLFQCAVPIRARRY